MSGLHLGNMPFCGCWFKPSGFHYPQYLPQVQLNAHTTILATTSKTTLRQTFHNPQNQAINEAVYMFPLYDGVSVAGFTYSVAGRTVVGVVKERDQARDEYEKAQTQGQTAGLLEQNVDAADVFTTSIGNIPAGEHVLVEITYLGELKNDAETDGIRFTIPTNIAPRYGYQAIQLNPGFPSICSDGMKITVDVELEQGNAIRGIRSPSHPIAISMGRTSAYSDSDDGLFESNLGSATLALGTTELDKDFLLVISANGQDVPKALLETHPTISNQRALLATLVPRFNVPSGNPEIVFVVDRSGSMAGKMHLVVDALKVFLKSLPVGVKFNICSFGSRHSFLFERSRTYDAVSLGEAMMHINQSSFSADFGGTDIATPVKDVMNRRYNDLSLEVMLMTDGEIWDQDALFKAVNEMSKQNARFFTLGIGSGASSALVEGVARAGRGFSQFVLDGERIDKRMVRMLKGALSPHIQYRLEIRYAQGKSDADDFEMVDSFEKSTNATASTNGNTLNSGGVQKPRSNKRKISLFSSQAQDEPNNPPAAKYDHLPSISIPAVVQTPHVLPELYPHNRTSVYLLLSPENHGRIPEAIILHGTTENEELELEIPVQDIGMGETIHKLATKQATQELAEGRGWLTSLHDEDGNSLQSTNEGKWDLIVEREAVRLCTTFQVAGKHCSFVAVERSNEDASSGTQVTLKPVAPPPSCHQQQSLENNTHVWRARMAPSVQVQYRRSSRQGLRGVGSDHGGQQFSGQSNFGNQMQQQMQPMAQVNQPVPSSRASARNWSRSQYHDGHACQSIAFSPATSPDSCDGEQDETSDRHDYISARRLKSRRRESSDISTLPVLDKMQRLISLQSFTGTWSASDEFVAIISHGAINPFRMSDVEDVKTDTLTNNDYTTVLAIAWLEVIMQDEKGVWEMVVEKARRHLQTHVGGSEFVNTLVDDVRFLWMTN